MRVLGIDEAGRGCVLGALFVGAFFCEDPSDDTLRAAGINDSKKLSPKTRNRLRTELETLGTCAVERIEVAQIDTHNLNALEEAAIVRLVRRFRPHLVVLDALGHPRTLPALRKRLDEALAPDGLAPAWVIEPKADARHAVCGAASIVAKVTRDEALAQLDAQFGPLGSGYPSDPKTRAWLLAHKDAPWPAFVRTKWATIQQLSP